MISIKSSQIFQEIAYSTENDSLTAEIRIFVAVVFLYSLIRIETTLSFLFYFLIRA